MSQSQLSERKKKVAKAILLSFLLIGSIALGSGFGWQAGLAAFFLIPLLRVPNMTMVKMLN